MPCILRFLCFRGVKIEGLLKSQFNSYLEDVIEDDDGLAAISVGIVLSAPVDLPEPLDLRGAKADHLARQRPPRGEAGEGRGDVEAAGAQDARRNHTLCKKREKAKYQEQEFSLKFWLGDRLSLFLLHQYRHLTALLPRKQTAKAAVKYQSAVYAIKISA